MKVQKFLVYIILSTLTSCNYYSNTTSLSNKTNSNNSTSIADSNSNSSICNYDLNDYEEIFTKDYFFYTTVKYETMDNEDNDIIYYYDINSDLVLDACFYFCKELNSYDNYFSIQCTFNYENEYYEDDYYFPQGNVVCLEKQNKKFFNSHNLNNPEILCKYIKDLEKDIYSNLYNLKITIPVKLLIDNAINNSGVLDLYYCTNASSDGYSYTNGFKDEKVYIFNTNYVPTFFYCINDKGIHFYHVDY